MYYIDVMWVHSLLASKLLRSPTPVRSPPTPIHSWKETSLKQSQGPIGRDHRLGGEGGATWDNLE